MVKLSRTRRGLGVAAFFLGAFSGLADGGFVAAAEAVSSLAGTLGCGVGVARCRVVLAALGARVVLAGAGGVETGLAAAAFLGLLAAAGVVFFLDMAEWEGGLMV
jgi:hypothetical protein